MIRHHGITRALTGLAAALLATAGIMPAANAADTSTPTSVRVDGVDETLTITAPVGQGLGRHAFTAVELAKIIDATAVDGKIIETAVTTNSNLTANITTAAKTAGATDADLTPDPMTWVAKTLTDSDTSPYAGKLRDFVTALANDTTVTKAATLPLTVSGNTATLTGEPGVYLVFDKATGAASLPILAATTVGYMTDKDGKLGTVDWKALTAPAPTKILTGINGNTNVNPATDVVNVGDKLTYEIVQHVPATTGYAHYRLSMTDSLPAALDAPALTAVKLDNRSLKADQYQTTVTTDQKTGTHTLTVTLGGTDGDALPIIDGMANRFLVITYSATVNNKARRDTSIDNTATTVYSDNPADWTHTGTVTAPTPVSVHTGGLTVKKTDRTGKPLSGAEFTLSVSGMPMKFTKQSDGVYTPDTNGTTTLTTGTDGLIKIDGIADKQITVTETKSPYGGSILPSFGATVHVNDTTGKTSLIQTAETDNYGLVTAPTDAAPDTVTVMNVQSLLQLPRTGLAGILLTAVPFTLLLAAGMLLTVKARRK